MRFAPPLPWIVLFPACCPTAPSTRDTNHNTLEAHVSTRARRTRWGVRRRAPPLSHPPRVRARARAAFHWAEHPVWWATERGQRPHKGVFHAAVGIGHPPTYPPNAAPRRLRPGVMRRLNAPARGCGGGVGLLRAPITRRAPFLCPPSGPAASAPLFLGSFAPTPPPVFQHRCCLEPRCRKQAIPPDPRPRGGEHAVPSARVAAHPTPPKKPHTRAHSPHAARAPARTTNPNPPRLIGRTRPARAAGRGSLWRPLEQSAPELHLMPTARRRRAALSLRHASRGGGRPPPPRRARPPCPDQTKRGCGAAAPPYRPREGLVCRARRAGLIAPDHRVWWRRKGRGAPPPALMRLFPWRRPTPARHSQGWRPPCAPPPHCR
jgi:hypothetical protein